MGRYIVRRPLRVLTSVLIFGILLIAAGGPTAGFQQTPRITAEQKEAFKKRWGLDQPWPIQYCRWVGVCNHEVPGNILGVLPPPEALISDRGLPNLLPSA